MPKAQCPKGQAEQSRADFFEAVGMLWLMAAASSLFQHDRLIQ